MRIALHTIGFCSSRHYHHLKEISVLQWDSINLTLLLAEVACSSFPKYFPPTLLSIWVRSHLLWSRVLWWFQDFLSPEIHVKKNLPENVTLLDSLSFYN